MRSPVTGRRRAALLGTLGAVALLVGPIASAGADPVNTGTASAFGATITAAGETVVPPTPEETTTLPPGGESSNTIVDVPADPLALSGTLTANTAVHEASDLDSTLVTETTQDVAGPYNAHAEGVVEDAEVLVDLVGEDVSLLNADVIRAEAVGVCRDGAVEYSATSEVIGLSVAGELLPLNPPVQDLVDAIGDLLTDTGLNAVVDVERNVVTTSVDGAAVDALVVTVLAALGEDPLAQVRIGHAEVGGLACGEIDGGGDLPECSDGVDNDDDGLIDHPDDPGCESPDDDSEDSDGGATAPECSDGIDNDGDGDVDHPADSDCDSPADDSEAGPAGPATSPPPGSNVGLPRTGSESTVALAAGFTLAGLALAARRFWSAA